jgi:hypothetical protein
MSKKDKAKNPDVSLDPATKKALHEGLKMSSEYPRRWTPQQVREDARELAKEWREKIKRASA